MLRTLSSLDDDPKRSMARLRGAAIGRAIVWLRVRSARLDLKVY